jgi:hypothetical protein
MAGSLRPARAGAPQEADDVGASRDGPNDAPAAVPSGRWARGETSCDQLIANTTVTVAEMSCEPGWIGVAASAIAPNLAAP